ncbi:hypothetical protein LCGC14_1336910 [marine sediment metagenome]|uniref:Uncharacterized protein n=1 Tax=marine sediment metagenome TaxID=412755 RepID=A0A0F9KFL4_9ZZZZ
MTKATVEIKRSLDTDTGLCTFTIDSDNKVICTLDDLFGEQGFGFSDLPTMARVALCFAINNKVGDRGNSGSVSERVKNMEQSWKSILVGKWNLGTRATLSTQILVLREFVSTIFDKLAAANRIDSDAHPKADISKSINADCRKAFELAYSLSGRDAKGLEPAYKALVEKSEKEATRRDKDGTFDLEDLFAA